MNPPARWGTLVDYLLITVGTALAALAVNAFYVPNHISDGGVAGLGIILFYLLHVPIWVTLAVVNLPLIWLSHRMWGGRVGTRTVYGSLLLSLWVGVLHVPAVTHVPLLATIYGGLVSGAGLGLVFRSRGTTGGSDVVARFLAHVFPLSVGQGMLLTDFFVIAGFGVAFHPVAAMYSLIALFVSSRAIDVVQEGVEFARQAWIFSDHHDVIGRRILDELGRGVTVVQATGLYTGQERPALYVVVSRAEVSKLKATVYAADPRAFMVMSGVHEVVGEGFRNPPPVE
jgi:uncharacterized membrane-anchored protein YitT (DUF2179 family)